MEKGAAHLLLPDACTDRTLVAQHLEGERAGFEEFYESHLRREGMWHQSDRTRINEMNARQFAALPESHRRQEIEEDLNGIAQLERHPFRNRREIKEATGPLIGKVNGHGLGLSNALIEQSSELEIDDLQATEEFEVAGGKRQWLEGFWNASFQSILQAVTGAMNSGQIGDLDAARRVHYLNESIYQTARDYLDTRGWDSDFGPHMSFVLRKNLDEALSAPRGAEFEVKREGSR
jgi:hypothetical protein